MVDSSPYHTPSPDGLPLWIQEAICRSLDRIGRWAPTWLHSMVGVAALVEKYGHLLTIQRADGRGLALPGGLLHWRESV